MSKNIILAGKPPCDTKGCPRLSEYRYFPQAGFSGPNTVCKQHIYLAIDNYGSSIVERL